MATNEKVETQEETKVATAIEKAKAAEENVKKIKAERAAKKAARCAKRLEWKGPFKPLGKLINAYDEHPGEMVTGTLLGGAAGAGAVIGIRALLDKFGNKSEVKATETTDVDDEVVIEDKEV